MERKIWRVAHRLELFLTCILIYTVSSDEQSSYSPWKRLWEAATCLFLQNYKQIKQIRKEKPNLLTSVLIWHLLTKSEVRVWCWGRMWMLFRMLSPDLSVGRRRAQVYSPCPSWGSGLEPVAADPLTLLGLPAGTTLRLKRLCSSTWWRIGPSLHLHTTSSCSTFSNKCPNRLQSVDYGVFRVKQEHTRAKASWRQTLAAPSDQFYRRGGFAPTHPGQSY